MIYFKSGLNKDELKKEYRELAKKYHPDLHPEIADATVIMQKINDEYDNYFSSFYSFFISYEDVKKEAEKSRQFILFMVKNKYGKGVISFEDENDWFGRKLLKIYSPDYKEWPTAHEGLAICEIINKSDFNKYTVKGNNIEMVLPNYTELSNYFFPPSKRYFDSYSGLKCKLTYINTEYGRLLIKDDEYNHSYANLLFIMNNRVSEHLISRQIFNQVEVLETLTQVDVPFLAFQDCTFEEFKNTHDVDWKSQYDSALQMIKLNDVGFSKSVIFAYMCRIKVISVYSSKLDYTTRYGTFNLNNLLQNLYKFNIDDIEEAQDCLDEMNELFISKVKSKIKKGKLKIVI